MNRLKKWLEDRRKVREIKRSVRARLKDPAAREELNKNVAVLLSAKLKTKLNK